MGRTLREIFALTTLALMGSAGLLLAGQNQYKGYVLNGKIGENTAVRLFYDPAASDYFHSPLVFHVAEQADARLVKPPETTEGRTAYISFSEMQKFLQVLSRSRLTWREYANIDILEPALQIPTLDTMEIVVVGPSGTARAEVRPSRICETLGPLDIVLKTKLAHWELQRFRKSYGCQVSGFDFNLYPERN
jgi:hypothetical protein